MSVPQQPQNLLLSKGIRIRDGPTSTINATNNFPLTEGCNTINTITRRTALAVPVTLPLLPVAAFAAPAADPASAERRAEGMWHDLRREPSKGGRHRLDELHGGGAFRVVGSVHHRVVVVFPRLHRDKIRPVGFPPFLVGFNGGIIGRLGEGRHRRRRRRAEQSEIAAAWLLGGSKIKLLNRYSSAICIVAMPVDHIGGQCPFVMLWTAPPPASRCAKIAVSECPSATSLS